MLNPIRLFRLVLAEGMGADSSVDTIDTNPQSAEFTAEWFAKSDIGDRITPIKAKLSHSWNSKQTKAMMLFS